MPKPALASKTVRNSLYSMVMGVGMSAVGWFMVPDNIDRLQDTAKIWGLERHMKLLISGGGILTTLFSVGSIKGRHQVKGEEAIFTPNWLPIGRNLADCFQSIGIGDVLQAGQEIRDVTSAPTSDKRLTEIADLVSKLHERIGGIEAATRIPVIRAPRDADPLEFTGQVNPGRIVADYTPVADDLDEPTLGGY